jgi:metal-sulfur cluster biosynthetic enzyme
MQTIVNVITEISKVMHPAINYSLVKLGIVKDVDLNDDTVVLTFVFPFPNIPIADQLISSIEKPINDMGLKMEYIVRVMTEKEKSRFMQLEAEAWKGM